MTKQDCCFFYIHPRASQKKEKKRIYVRLEGKPWNGTCIKQI